MDYSDVIGYFKIRSSIKVFLVLCIVLSYSPFCYSQTDNDDMENAEQLRLNEFVNSFTHGNTLQYHCIDEKLTGKCIKYHNDQWFTFNAGQQEQLYVNISNQKCRDLYGVQLIVLEGELCRPETYTILACESLGTQDDIYVSLDGLKMGQDYWLIIDGYLHDYCEFHIEVADQPKGVSVQKFDLLEVETSQEKNIVGLQWQIPDSLNGIASHVSIMRRKGNAYKFNMIDQLKVAYNAYGEMKTGYQYYDTLLLAGRYYYRVVMSDINDKQYLVGEYDFRISEPYGQLSSKEVVKPTLRYRQGTSLTLTLINVETEEIVDSIDLSYHPTKHSNFTIFTNKYVRQGINALEIRIHNHDDGGTKSEYFYLIEKPEFDR